MKKLIVFCLVSLSIGFCNAYEYIPNTILLERNEHTPNILSLQNNTSTNMENVMF